MSALSVPPSGLVWWRASYVTSQGEPACVDHLVRARTWFKARQRAAVRLGVAPELLEVVMVPSGLFGQTVTLAGLGVSVTFGPGTFVAGAP